MTPGCCPFCGAEYRRGDAACWDCRVSPSEPPPPDLAPDQPGDEAVYELDDWPVTARLELTAALAERGVPTRWEPGLVLAVREEDDRVAEEVLDALEARATVAAAGPEVVAAFDLDGALGLDHDDAFDHAAFDDGDDADDDGAVAQAAMADVFLAADRLMHEPDDEVVAGELAQAAAVVADSQPPYGIDPELWQGVGERATALCGALRAGAGDEVVVDQARTLRDVLRPLV